MKPKVTKLRFQALQTSDREHLVLTETDESITADSVYLSGGGTDCFGVHYQLVCNKDWSPRQFSSQIMGQPGRLFLRRTAEGIWFDEEKELPHLSTATDLDLSITPFTNTPVIRRLALATGQSADITVAYVAYPDHSIMLDPQRYTRMEQNEYIFESVDSDFKSQISVDDLGLVVYYPELFARIG